MNLATIPQPEKPPSAQAPEISIKIDLDDRCFAFPDGKPVSHLLLIGRKGGRAIGFDAIYAFNQTHQQPRIIDMSLGEAQGFIRELLNAVYYAKTSFYVSDTIRITINVAANGYHLEFLRSDQQREIYLSTGSIWRFIKGVLLAIDSAAPVVAN